MAQIIQLESPATERPLATSLYDVDPRDASIRTDAVFVLFTSIDETLAAVRVGRMLAKGLCVPLTLVHTWIVPYVLPVDAPSGLSPVQTDAFMHEVRAAGREVGVEVRVRVYLCRDAAQVFPLAFRPHSLIIVAGQHSWWPTRTERWRRALEDAGHFVVFVDISGHQERSDA
jgi:hypothetical protein